MNESRLIGDILVLAIDRFGIGRAHSNSTHDGSIPEAAFDEAHFPRLVEEGTTMMNKDERTEPGRGF